MQGDGYSEATMKQRDGTLVPSRDADCADLAADLGTMVINEPDLATMKSPYLTTAYNTHTHTHTQTRTLSHMRAHLFISHIRI